MDQIHFGRVLCQSYIEAPVPKRADSVSAHFRCPRDNLLALLSSQICTIKLVLLPITADLIIREQI